MPFFSVIVPVYKVEEYLPQCVESILGQTFSDFELLLIDDGSPDNSGEMCDRYAELDQRVQVIHKENGGLSSARNCGLKIAKGEFVAFLDSDDYWDKADALELIYKEISASGSDVVLLKHKKLHMQTGQVEGCDDFSSTKDIEYLSYAEQLKFCVSKQFFDTCAWNKVFRRNLMQKCDLFFVEGIISEDLDWAARLSLAASRLAIVSDPVHVYRKGRVGSITSSIQLKNLIDTKASIERCIDYVRSRDLPDVFLEAYFSYVSYRYVIWMAESAVVADNAKKQLVNEMKKHEWLLQYKLNRKVAMTSNVRRIVGYQLSCKILGFYLSRK